MSNDILIYETGNGGDIAVINNDIALGDLLLQQAYLALFGGNVEADTLGNELATQIRYDWWGNSLLLGKTPAQQFNSQTERALNNNALNSTGRVNIQRAVEADMSHLNGIATVAVSVSLPAPKRLEIMIKLTPPGGQQSVALQVLWDNTKNEMIIKQII